MAQSVYIETTIISYLTSRPSRDLIVAANQQLTHEWWNTRRPTFDLFVSQLVILEAGVGDPIIAQQRLAMITDLPLLGLTGEVRGLAQAFVAYSAVPDKALTDALHIAIAAVHGIEYLLTWNCKHIANATTRPVIEDICRKQGFGPPVICTPQELMEE